MERGRGRRPEAVTYRTLVEDPTSGTPSGSVAGLLPSSVTLDQYEESTRLLQRAVKLLDNADLKGASEMLQQAAGVLAPQSGDIGGPDQRI